MPPHDITIVSRTAGFSPATFHANVGQTVVWYQADNNHTVTPDTSNPAGWSSGSSTLGKGDTYSHTFNIAGTYTYHCQIHPSMTGTIVVGGG